VSAGNQKVILLGVFVTVAALIGIGVGLILPGRDTSVELDGKSAVLQTPTDGVDRLELTGGLFVNDGTAAAWVRDNPKSPLAKQISDAIASQPTAQWFYDWKPDLTGEVRAVVDAAAETNRVPVISAYESSVHGCDSPLSKAGSSDSLLQQTEAIARGIGDATVILIVQPDSLDGVFNPDCVPVQEKEKRFAALGEAIELYRTVSPNAQVYLGGGPFFYDKDSFDPANMAERLDAAGVAGARGFAVNVRGYQETEAMVTYAEDVNDSLEEKFGYRKPYVVDTSRSGAQVADACNPTGARIGEAPRVAESGEGPEIFLWIAHPGESDGDCGTAPKTTFAEFSPELAASLASGG
jgi:endoglucanase